MTEPKNGVPPDLAKLGESDAFLLSVAGQVREQLDAIVAPVLNGSGKVLPPLTVDQVRPLVNTLAAAMTAAVGGPALGTRLLSGDGTQIAVRVSESERGQREWKLMDLTTGSVSYNAEMVLPGEWNAVTKVTDG